METLNHILGIAFHTLGILYYAIKLWQLWRSKKVA